MNSQPLRVGIGGPVGSGKTALDRAPWGGDGEILWRLSLEIENKGEAR